MATGRSLHIGVNEVDPCAYNGASLTLVGPQNDAAKMRDIALHHRFIPYPLLLTRAATHRAVTDAICRAAQDCDSDDIFLLSFAGHGSQIPDGNGDEPFPYGDHTWALYDREFVDDELRALWTVFKPGVRVVLLNDSCHSEGSATGPIDVERDRRRTRLVPPAVQTIVVEQNAGYFAELQKRTDPSRLPPVLVRGLEFAACRRWQDAEDGDPFGLFTGTLAHVWDEGSFRGTYGELQSAICELMPNLNLQLPSIQSFGDLSLAMERQLAFLI